MGSDLLRRVRWGNVGLACAVLAALATVVAWPALTTTTPALPSDTARPLIASGPDDERSDTGPPVEEACNPGAAGARRCAEGAGDEGQGSAERQDAESGGSRSAARSGAAGPGGTGDEPRRRRTSRRRRRRRRGRCGSAPRRVRCGSAEKRGRRGAARIGAEASLAARAGAEARPAAGAARAGAGSEAGQRARRGPAGKRGRQRARRGSEQRRDQAARTGVARVEAAVMAKKVSHRSRRDLHRRLSAPIRRRRRRCHRALRHGKSLRGRRPSGRARRPGTNPIRRAAPAEPAGDEFGFESSR